MVLSLFFLVINYSLGPGPTLPLFLVGSFLSLSLSLFHLDTKLTSLYANHSLEQQTLFAFFCFRLLPT